MADERDTARLGFPEALSSERPLTTAKCHIDGPADASLTVELAMFDIGDCPAAHIRLQMDQGCFSVNTDGSLPHRYAIGGADRERLVLSLRDRGDGELAMLALALRWIADHLDRPQTSLATVVLPTERFDTMPED